MYLWIYRLILVVFLVVSAPLLLPDTFLPITWHPLLLIVVALLWPVHWITDRLLLRKEENRTIRPQATPPPIWPISLIMLWLPVNLWSSVDASTSWTVIGYLLLGVTLYGTIIPLLPLVLGKKFLANRSLPEMSAFYAELLLLGIGTLLSLCFPFIVMWKPQFRLFYLPIYDALQSWQLNLGETVHPNILAGALVLTIPITITAVDWRINLYREDKGKTVPILRNLGKIGLIATILVSLFLQFSAIILSQSRGSYLAVISAMAIIAILRWPRLAYFLPIVVGLVVVGIRVSGPQLILEQVSSDGSLGGWAGRLEIWQTSLMAIADFSFTGIGIGTFTTVIPLLYPLSFPIESYPHAHNLLLQIGIDLGIPGLIAYLALWINLVTMLIVTLRGTPRHTKIHSMAIGAAGSMVGMFIHGILDAVTWGTKVSFLPWLLFALITQMFLTLPTRQNSRAPIDGA